MAWPRCSIGRIAPARPATVQFGPEELVWQLGLDQIEGHTGRLISKLRLPAAKAGSSTFVFDQGNVLYSKLRPYLNKVLVPDEPGIATTELVPLRPCRDLLIPKYLAYYLRSAPFLSFASRRVTGTKMPRLLLSELWAHEIPLPPLSEQRRIVDLLDQVDRLRQFRVEADATVDRILPALFLKMFGDPETNPMNWPVCALGCIAEVVSGGAFPRSEQGRTEGELPFIKVSDMNLEGNEWFINRANNFVSADTLSRLRVKPASAGTTVFPKIGAAIGTNKKRLLVRPTAFDNNVIGVSPRDPAFSSYLFGFFQLFDLCRLARATAVPSIRASELSALPVPKPSVAVASSFSAQLEGLTEIRAAADQGRRVVDDLFKVLAHRAFRGRLAGLLVTAGRTTGVRDGATPRQAQPETAPEDGCGA